MTERLRVLFAVELDRDRLLEHRDELLSRGEVLYHEETFSAGTITVKDWPGEPHEWESLTDLVDLMAPGVDAITRTELLEVGEGPAPLVQLSGRKRSGWRRLVPWLPVFVAIVVALSFAGTGNAVTKIGTNGPDVLVGTPHADTLDGRGGSDVLKGRGGPDELLGKRGDDALLGGRGADFLNGGFGHDYLTAGRGADTIVTLDGDFDLIHSCGPGIDTVLKDALDFVADDCEVIL